MVVFCHLPSIIKNSMIKKRLQEYDKLLLLKRNLDGSKSLYRKSPFHKTKYELIKFTNQFIGSGDWVMNKLMSMDTQRNNIFEHIRRSDLEIMKTKSTFDLSREAAYEITREYI